MYHFSFYVYREWEHKFCERYKEGYFYVTIKFCALSRKLLQSISINLIKNILLR